MAETGKKNAANRCAAPGGGKGTLTSLAGGSVLVLATLACLAGCGGVEDSGPAPLPSAAVNGVWGIGFDYGNGLVAHQNLTILQSGNSLTLTTDSPDLYGPLPGVSPISGYIYGNGISASWSNTWAPCRYSTRLEATLVAFNNLSGALYWGRSGYGAGYCPGAVGKITLRGNQ